LRRDRERDSVRKKRGRFLGKRVGVLPMGRKLGNWVVFGGGVFGFETGFDQCFFGVCW